MTKRELINFLEPFDDDIEVYSSVFDSATGKRKGVDCKLMYSVNEEGDGEVFVLPDYLGLY